jgi:hypothetical protein
MSEGSVMSNVVVENTDMAIIINPPPVYMAQLGITSILWF